jgi:hypothetical protein
MKKYIYITLCLLIPVSLFAQREDFVCSHVEEEDVSFDLRAGTSLFSGNGHYFTPKGDLRALIICAGFGPQYDNSFSIGNWDASPGALPTYLLNKSTIYSDVSDFSTYSNSGHNANISRFYYEMSNYQFRLMVDVYPQRITIDATGAGSFGTLNKRVIEKMKEEDPDFDWSKYDLRKNDPGFSEDASGYAPDGKPDFVIVLYRYSTTMPNQPVAGMSRWQGSTGGYSSLNGISNINYNGYTFSGSGFTVGTCTYSLYRTFIHETAHGVFDCPHYSAANGVVGNYFYGNWGWGMMSLDLIAFPCALGWEKWYLNWIDGIKANGVNTDIKSVSDLNASGEYTLRDFLTTGDLVRIKIPNSGGRNQYLWLENHQGISIFDRRNVLNDGCGNTLPLSPKGLVAYIEAIQDDRTQTSIISSGANGIRYLHPRGNFDYAFDTPSTTPCHAWNNIIYNFREIDVNPIGGQSRLSHIRQDFDSNNVIDVNTHYNSYTQQTSNPVKNESTFVLLKDSVITYDGWNTDITFSQGQKLSMSSNPCLVNFPTYNRNTKKLSAFVLNGISVEVLDYVNGDAKIKITYNDVAIDNNIRYTGLIHLPDITQNENPDIIIRQGITLSIDKSGTPNRETKTPAGDFINPTEFHCLENAFFQQEENSIVEVKNGSTLIIGGKYEINKNAILRVKSGSYLQIKQSADLRIKDSGKIIIEPGAYICVESGANIYLQTRYSIISIQIGAQIGANPALFSNASCQSIISYTGNGKVDLPIIGKNSINCKETTFSPNTDFPNAIYTWTTSPNIQIVSGQNTDTVKVKGKSHNLNSWIQVQVTYNGQTYTEKKEIPVNIPNAFILEMGKPVDTNDGKKQVSIRAVASPAGTQSGSYSYNWSVEGGTIEVGMRRRYIYEDGMHIAYIDTLASKWIKKDIPGLEQSVSYKAEDDSEVQIKPIARASGNLSSSKSALFEVTTTSATKKTTEYIAVEINDASAPNTANKWVFDVNDDFYNLKMDIESLATLTYSPTTPVTVICEIMGCEKSFSASLYIPAYPYTASYSPANRSIRLLRDQGNSAAGNVQTYRVQLYNDQGYLKTVTFTSNQENVLIPLNSLPSGNYYINVLDANGNIVDRKLIPVY